VARQRYLLRVFSTGLMIPIGYEFGSPNTCTSSKPGRRIGKRPLDLTDFITNNRMKLTCPVLAGPMAR
jgi:hypothetical protein